ncbi:MAG TPA: aspartate/glutamate racemase family protein, partial [Ramlibacter sp.]|nr:aspartate/glutamate racemase family protein [Ramlibacter sp.]
AAATAADPRSLREYSARALFGVAVPQANPIVEPEFAALMPAGVGVIATRLQGSRSDSRNRLVQYLENLDASLEAFDTARPDALGYACTGTSYLVDGAEERQRLEALAQRFGYPIVTAADAIVDALAELGMRRIAVLAPYPQWMADASHRYWEQRGLAVVAAARTTADAEDTRHIYRIRTAAVLETARALDASSADVVLMTGTGMPTLRAIPEVARMTGKPVLSSNLCLAWALLRRAGVAIPAARRELGECLLGGWSERVAAL